MQAIQLFRTNWFVMGLSGCAFFGLGLLMMGLNYYWCGRILDGTFLQANPLILVGLAMVMASAAIKKIEDRMTKLEAREQDEKQFDASSITTSYAP